MRSVPISCCLGLFLVVASALAQQPPAPDSYRYRVEVGMVLVPASVSTPDGIPVTALDQAAFEVFEDGQPRPIRLFERETALPLVMVLMVDASLSAASELHAEKEAMARFIQRVLRPVDLAALYELSGGVKVLADFSDPPANLIKNLKLIKTRAGTALYDAVVEAAGKLREREGRRVIVVVSDGNDTTSKEDFHAAVRALQEAEATVFSLIVRPIPGVSGRSVRGEHVLTSFADLSGGRVFLTSRVGELDRFFDELSEMLRTQYLIGYQPAPTGLRSEFRAIEVRVKGGDYKVRHRTGYYTEPAQ